MAFYKYVSNLSPSDRFDQITIMLDNGTSMVMQKGLTYSLSDSELFRARQRVVMSSSGAPASQAQRFTSLPVLGDLIDGDVPVWSSSNGAFIPGTGGGGGSSANSKGVAMHNGTSYPARPTGFASVEWIGPTDPGGSAQNGDTWVPTA